MDTLLNLFDTFESFFYLIPSPYYTIVSVIFGIIVARSLIGIVQGG